MLSRTRMYDVLSALALRLRVITDRFFARAGLREDTFLLILAVLIGIVTAVAAVAFHGLIGLTRDLLYGHGGDFLYTSGIALLVVWPALGGLAVGAITKYIVRAREGHGIVDVIESVVKTSGFQRPSVAIEKIVTSGITIGTGGSCGAEGPIVQIGAAIASGVGSLFRIARHSMPTLIGCGSAAGISAIFNAPIGGVLFTLEVILQDFSIRTFTPIVVASVIANVTTRALFVHMDPAAGYAAIFAMPPQTGQMTSTILDWPQVGNFVLLGAICGGAGALLTRLMVRVERLFHRIQHLGPLRPALGGVVVGILGIAYVLIFGRLLLHQPKPFAFTEYPMPAFFGDGYGVIHRLLANDFYGIHPFGKLLLLLGFLSMVKILATCLTLGSGGSGGVIAPSLFIGAAAGGFLGILLDHTHWFHSLHPEFYALVGMGAVLAAVVHAPIASTLILLELTQDYRITVPAMLATVSATGFARLLHRDSIYTQALRLRGIRFGDQVQDMRRLYVEQVPMEPAAVLQANEPFQRVLDLTTQLGTVNFVVIDKDGRYMGMVVSDDINLALIQREAVPLLVVSELMRADVPLVQNSDNLAAVYDQFIRHNVTHLPVCLSNTPGKVIGLVSRAGVVKLIQGGAS